MRDITVDGLVLRYLRTAGDIDAVRALRGHIDLAVHSVIDPLFFEREKKETSSAWHSLLRSRGNSWEQFVPCRWGMA